MFFHDNNKILGAFSLSIGSKASGIGETNDLIVLKPDGYTFIITRLRFNFVDKPGIENVLLTAKRQQAEIDIFTKLKLGSIGKSLKNSDPELDLLFNSKETALEISNNQNLIINCNTPILLDVEDITLTLFGYKLKK